MTNGLADNSTWKPLRDLINGKLYAYIMEQEVENDLGMTVQAFKKTKSRGGNHGRYHSYEVSRLKVDLVIEATESDSKFIEFTGNKKDGYQIDWLKVGKISAEEMKQLIAIFKKD